MHSFRTDCCRPCLACALPKKTVRVRGVEGEDALSRRLVELGLLPGTEVRLIARAPFGGALLFGLRGFRLALRTEEAERVLIEAGDPS